MANKIRVLLTGANGGLGFQAARELCRREQPVILACRNQEKANTTAEKLRQEFPKARLHPVACDLANLESVQIVVNGLKVPVHALICNAGLSLEEPTQRTQQGVEMTFGVNHLGHFALTLGLLNKFPNELQRILVVSSELHQSEGKSGPFPAVDLPPLRELAYPEDEGIKDWKTEGRRRYVHSKLCNMLFVKELHRRLQAAGLSSVKVNGYNPGFVPQTGLARSSSGFTRFLMRFILPVMGIFISAIRSPRKAGTDMVAVCLEADESGAYYDGTELSESSALSKDNQLGKELWDLSVEISGEELKGGTSS